MNRIVPKLITCMCSLALAAGLVVGCSAANVPANPEQQANRSYMSQVNEIMDRLDVELDSFVDAVSRGDVVNMRTQADNAYITLDKLSTLEVPEGLSDIQQSYLDGTKKLREALDDYITLYTEIDSGSFDQSTYNTRIKEIQSLYDEGVDALKKGDEAAATKQ